MLNDLHKEMYKDLMTLVETNEAFYYSDHIHSSKTLRIFLYRLCSYSQWLLPHALEARGITFEVDGDEMVELVSWPFCKFFNYKENPFTMDLDFTKTIQILDKMDGSLISSMLIDGRLWLKSKGSLFSDQAIAANRFIRLEESIDLLNFVESMATENRTVCMEYTAPDNRIVIGYPEAALTVLCVRDNETGRYLPLDMFEDDYEDASVFFVDDAIESVKQLTDNNVEAFVDKIPEMEDIEGYVLLLSDGTRVKIKTEWYLVLHRIKDSINSQRRLFEAIVYETIDDVKAAFYDDEMALETIDNMEIKVLKIQKDTINTVENFHADNKHLDRKGYAIKGQKELEKVYFGLAMNLYLGYDVDYKVFMIKNRIKFGIKDDPKSEKEV